MHSPLGVQQQPSIHDRQKQQKEVLTFSHLEGDNSAWSLGGPVAHGNNQGDHTPVSLPHCPASRTTPQTNDLRAAKFSTRGLPGRTSNKMLCKH